MPFEGLPLPLSLQTHDGDLTKFVRASLVDELGATIGGSPVLLTSVGLGKYTSDAIVMPGTVVYIEATYEVFDDALFTIPSPDHTIGTDVFPLEISDTVIVDLLNEIKTKVCAIKDGLMGVTPGVDALATVLSDVNIVGTIVDDALDLIVTQEPLVATIKEDALTGVPQDDKLIGVIKCP